MPTAYPIVPGHEIVGRVAKVGPTVTRYKPGDLAAVRLGLAGPSAAEAHLVQMTVLDPAGQEVPALSEVVRLTADGREWHLPLALNDWPGAWRVRATDALGGGAAEAVLQVR